MSSGSISRTQSASMDIVSPKAALPNLLESRLLAYKPRPTYS